MDNITKSWYELDNAATIYPYSSNSQWICSYRVGFILKDEVDPKILEQAVKDIMPRFPSFFLQLRFGYFWPYLERTDSIPIIEQEHLPPVLPTPRWYTNVPAVKVIYYKRRLCIEAFHGLADGGGAIAVLKTLTAQYLRLKGVEIPQDNTLINLDSKPTSDEVADNFKRFYDKSKKGMNRAETSSYQHTIKPIKNYNRIFQGLVPIADVKAYCKAQNATITEVLTAVFIYSLYINSPKSNKLPVKVSVPVSLRPLFGVNAMRNFSLFTNIGAELKADKSTTVEDIINSIRGKIKQNTTKEIMEQNITMNVSTAKNPVVRILPNGIKRIALKIGYKNGQKKFACTISNLGPCLMPEQMQACIDRMEVHLGGPRNAIGCAINSFGDKLNIAFNVSSRQTDVIRTFYQTLTQLGMRLHVESSDWEERI